MNREQGVFLTAEGIEKLRRELDELVGVSRPALAGRLRRAIQQGDLTENADYIAAKEEQGFLEGRIQRIEAMLRKAVVIEPAGAADRVGIGNRVTVVEEGVADPEVYHLVGPAEADPGNGRISYESPLGQALLERQPGEVVRVQAPAGETLFRILSID
jgi:transcription elongation factor GreA